MNTQVLFYVALVLFSVLKGPCVYGARQMRRQGSKNQVQVSQSEENFANAISPTTTNVVAVNAFGSDISLPLISASGGNFIIKVSFGTPAKEFALLMDTGSDVTWISCKTNNQQDEPNVFDPTLSSTFSNATCDPDCNRVLSYHDGSNATIYFVKDTLSIASNLMFPNFLFGCAQTVNGDFAGATGVLGLDQGKYSLSKQTNRELLSSFCYCLPAADSSNGYIVFGVQAFDTCSPDTTKFISLIPNPDPNGLTSYFVKLKGITIGLARLDFDQSLNANVDSGTPIGRLPPDVYAVLRAAFKALMLQYTSVDSPAEPMDTCYIVTDSWEPPSLTLHFDGGINVNLGSSAAVTRESNSVVCLAFAGNSDPKDLTFIGNQQQRGMLVFYDITSGNLALRSGTC